MNLTDNVHRVRAAHYLRREGRVQLSETPEQLCKRVARAVGKVGKRCDGINQSEAYRQMLGKLDFLPNSPTLINAGTERGQAGGYRRGA
jgi:ribonucleoside-diphosphate reductase alpha chain